MSKRGFYYLNFTDGFHPLNKTHPIKFAGKVFHVQAVAETIGMKKPTHQYFGFGVGTTDAAHVIAAGCCVVYIGHSQK